MNIGSSIAQNLDFNLDDLMALPAALETEGRDRDFGRRRVESRVESEIVIDEFPGHAIQCGFVRVSARISSLLTRFQAPGEYAITTCHAGGWLLIPSATDSVAYWLPLQPMMRGLDDALHVVSERPAQIDGVDLSRARMAMQISLPACTDLDWLFWKFPRKDEAFIGELTALSPLETQPHFLWGSHTLYKQPSDIYQHLIHSHVYENRYAWPYKRKICSENDAHALYVTLCGLEHTTGKRIYGLLKTQLLLSVLSRQSEDGGFRHGEWTEGMESHYRLHCSAMHMMMDALAERENPAVRTALERAAAFIARQTDNTNLGCWFIHDELEHRPETMNKGPFGWIPGRVLGKSESNMLVLNTHLDATIALDRYRELTGDGQYAGLVRSACDAAKKVLALRPAEWLYGALFRAIGLTLLPTAVAERLPLPARALKRIAWKYLVPRLPAIKTRWPRLVMPGGYIDREISLKVWAHDYHSINVMDLLRFLRRFPDEALWEIAEAALRFGQESGLRERWLEIKGREYAVGFWAEALYHACALRPDPRYRAWLADTMLLLADRNIGLPPSLLGANAEAVPPCEQAPCPMPADGRLRVANLSRHDRFEVLVINPAPEPVPLGFERGWDAVLAWSDAEGARHGGQTPAVVPARGWVLGHARREAHFANARTT